VQIFKRDSEERFFDGFYSTFERKFACRPAAACKVEKTSHSVTGEIEY
jgi:hypothetical protein